MSTMKLFYRPWTPACDAELARLHNTGISYREIGKAMNRSHGAICTRCTKLGLFRETHTRRIATGEAAYGDRRYEDIVFRVPA